MTYGPVVVLMAVCCFSIFLSMNSARANDDARYVQEDVDAYFALLEKIQVTNNQSLDFGDIAFGGPAMSGQCLVHMDPADGDSVSRRIHSDSSSSQCTDSVLVGDAHTLARVEYSGSVGSVHVDDDEVPFDGVAAYLRPDYSHDDSENTVWIGGILRIDGDAAEAELTEGVYSTTIQLELEYDHIR